MDLDLKNGGQQTKMVKRGGECNDRENEEHWLAKWHWKADRHDQVVITRLRTSYSQATHRRKTGRIPHPAFYGSAKKQRKKDERVIWRKKYERKVKKEQKCWKNIDTKTQIGTKKEQTRNDEGNCKDRQRKLESRKKWNVKMKKKCNRKIRFCS
jgi:hypothetical protein